MEDRFGLGRFVAAQDFVYREVLAELHAGRKRSHWMWFIFPQYAGLGSSSMAQRYAIGSLEEAEAYLKHPVLGPRLRECTEIVLGITGPTAEQIFGYPDDMKFRSSMTLFDAASREPANPFRRALDQFFSGVPDQASVELLKRSG